MFERQDLAVDRVHAVQGLLDQEPGFGLDRGLRGGRELAQKLGGQRDTVGHRQAAAVQRDLAAGVAKLRAKMAAMHLGQLERRHVAQPDKKRGRRVRKILIKPRRDAEKRLLNDVGTVDAPGQPAAQAELDHPLHPVAIARKMIPSASWLPAAARRRRLVSSSNCSVRTSVMNAVVRVSAWLGRNGALSNSKCNSRRIVSIRARSF